MPNIPEILREIHRLRRLARDLQQEIDRAPIQLKARKNVCAKAEQAFRDAQDGLKHLKVANHEKEVTLKSTFGQIARYTQQLNEVADKKQYDALQHEIAAAKDKTRGLEEEIFNGIVETEERTAALPGIEQASKKAREDFTTFEKEHAARLEMLKLELASATVDLKAAEQRIPEDVKAQYNRLVNSYGADSLAPMHEKTCAHCHTLLTEQQRYDLENGEFVCCRSCGRGLYLAS